MLWPVDIIVAAFFTSLGFLAVGLMAYFATRPEKDGPRCPRCLVRVRTGAAACRACRLPLDWFTEEDAPR